MTLDLSRYGITQPQIHRNASVPTLYQLSLAQPGGALADNGALIAYSNLRTGRSPKDKRIVDEPSSHDDIWWGSVNIPLPPDSFEINRQTALSFLNTKPQTYCVDGFAGWDPRYRIKVRILCARPYHALFMRNMLIRPTPAELAEFGDPDWLIVNAGQCPADPATPGLTGKTSIAVNFAKQEMIILGSEYAGEMKKGVFTVLHYVLPKRGVLSMHCSANEGSDNNVALFFGLSGTGKTTLSADPKRQLIGDDEHGWSDEGVFNFEGGCYAKAIRLRAENEPEIFSAIRFGSVMENVVIDEQTGRVDYDDVSITENTRVAYPIEYIDNAKIPCVAGHPKNIIFLTCDAFGVLPPVSRLTPEQAMYHFISGYTAKVAGTEMGVTEPEATFSACFGAAFLVWHPMVYAEMLRDKMNKHSATAWLINTGWTGGAYGTGARIDLKHTRTIVDAVLAGQLNDAQFNADPVFGLQVPQAITGVPSDLLDPAKTWTNLADYKTNATKLAQLFKENFAQYADRAGPEVLAVEPKTA